MNTLFLLGPASTGFYAFQVMPGKMNKAWLFFRGLGWYVNHEGGLIAQKKINYFFATPDIFNPGIRVMEITEHHLPEIKSKTIGLSLHFENSTPEEVAQTIIEWAIKHEVSGRSSVGIDGGKTIVLLPELFNFELEIS